MYILVTTYFAQYISNLHTIRDMMIEAKIPHRAPIATLFQFHLHSQNTDLAISVQRESAIPILVPNARNAKKEYSVSIHTSCIIAIIAANADITALDNQPKNRFFILYMF